MTWKYNRIIYKGQNSSFLIPYSLCQISWFSLPCVLSVFEDSSTGALLVCFGADLERDPFSSRSLVSLVPLPGWAHFLEHKSVCHCSFQSVCPALPFSS